jgi:hypothetical protein
VGGASAIVAAPATKPVAATAAAWTAGFGRPGELGPLLLALDRTHLGEDGQQVVTGGFAMEWRV